MVAGDRGWQWLKATVKGRWVNLFWTVLCLCLCGIGAGVTDGHSAIASDGRFLYIHNVVGLHKVGSGYGGTVKVRC